MNFLQLARRLKVESARSGAVISDVTTATGDDARLVNWIADQWLELQRRPHGWSWMRRELDGATIIGQRLYAAAELDADVSSFSRWMPGATNDYEVTSGDASGKWPLRWLPWEKFRSAFELRESAAAAPRYWSISPEEKLAIGPTPDGIYSINASYYRGPLELTENESLPTGLPAEYHLILVWGALMQVANFDAAPEVYTRAFTNFENMDTELRHRFGPRIDVGFNKL